MKKLILIFGLLAAIFITQCVQKEANPVGSTYFNDQDLGDVKYQTLYSVTSDTSFFKSTTTGSSGFLYIGNMEDMQSGSLFQFTGIEDTSDIDSAIVLLSAYRVINKNVLPAVINVHLVTSSWDGSTLTSDDFDESMIGNPIASITVSNDTTDSLYFKLDNEIASSWMDTSTSDLNYGLYLESEDDFMLQCFSRELSSTSNIGPQLLLYFTDDSTTRYPKINKATSDIFIATSQTELDEDHLIIENGTAYRSFLEFDLSIFSPTTIINHATLKLTADTLQSLPKIDELNGLIVCYLDSAFNFESMECESQNSATGIFENGEGVIDFTYQIQSLISDKVDNFGFLIKGQYESIELGRIVFYSTTADSTLQPKLEVTYTLPPINQP